MIKSLVSMVGIFVLTCTLFAASAFKAQMVTLRREIKNWHTEMLAQDLSKTEDRQKKQQEFNAKFKARLDAVVQALTKMKLTEEASDVAELRDSLGTTPGMQRMIEAMQRIAGELD